MKFDKLTRDDKEKTKIAAGHTMFEVDDLENEINMDSEIGRKLKSVEKELEKY